MKKRKPPKSPGPHSVKLSPLETEIMNLHLQGKSIMEIQRWLKSEKNVTIAYSNLYTFIHRRAEKYAATSGTSVIKQFMHLSPETKEEVLEILLALMHKDIPAKQKKEKKQTPQPSYQAPDPDGFMKIKDDDPPEIKKLKMFAALDSKDLYDKKEMDAIKNIK